MERIRNVVVLGDSLSDIGTKWKTFTGKLAIKVKQMTVSPTGRFSDCRNWTDFMFTAATGKTLFQSTPEATITASAKHRSLGKESMIPLGSESWFRYANYAEGGACGSTPAGLFKAVLGQLKDQTAKFKKDWTALRASVTKQAGHDDTATLFFVWFGANDLYTAGCKNSDMKAVAIEVATTRRNELAAIVGKENARFIFCNLAQPMASVRFQEKVKQAADEAKRKQVEQKVEELRKGVQVFNLVLSEETRKNGDVYVDIATCVSPDNMTHILADFGLLPGSQKEGTSEKYVTGGSADAHTQIATEDKAHPTDKLYEVIWKKIEATVKTKKYAFGKLAV